MPEPELLRKQFARRQVRARTGYPERRGGAMARPKGFEPLTSAFGGQRL
jgi:hypothetical protein